MLDDVLHNLENPWESSKPARNVPPRNPAGPTRPSTQKDRGGRTPPPFPPQLNDLMHPDNHGRAIVVLAVLFVIAWVLSGLYRVLPEENAVVLRFGQYVTTVTDPGLHYHLPRPIERVLKPNVTFERRIEVGYRGAFDQRGDKQDVPEESMMLTGDANIVDLDFVVQWKIANAKEFLFNIRDPEVTLKRVAESAMREVTGQNKLQDIITDGREDIGLRVKSIMQGILDSYNSGLMVTQVLIQDSSVPAPVLDAFEDVIRATQQADTMRNQALRYRNEIVPRAEGDAIRLIKEAEGYEAEIVARAEGDAKRFTSLYESYAAAKDVTRSRLYIETWEKVLKNSNTVILDSNGKSAPLSYFNLNELQKGKGKTETSPMSDAQESMR